MLNKAHKKIAKKFLIYKQDINTKGLYWSVVHRLYKLPKGRQILTPLVNLLKPNYIMLEGFKLWIDKKDLVVSQELVVSGKWEEFETEILKKHLKKGDIVLDIGAHIGYYTLIASQIIGKNGRVYAFEPDSRNFRLLKKNVNSNRIDNVTLVNKAVTNFSGTMKLFLNKENSGDHRVYDLGDSREFVKIRSITLDNFFKGKSQRVDFIKMDIQGSEPLAFKGGLKIINKNKKITLLTEFLPEGLKLCGSSMHEYDRLLRHANFKLYNIDEREKIIRPINSKELTAPKNEAGSYFKNLLCLREIS